MFRIRRSQMKAFNETAATAFERRLVEELRRFWPERCEQLGNPATAELVHRVCHAARRYRIETLFDTLRYLNLVMALGEEFDQNAKNSWIVAQLTDSRFDPSTALDRICKRVSHQLRAEPDESRSPNTPDPTSAR